MKNMRISNRIGLCLNAALLTLTLSLLVGTVALGRGNDNHGRIIHSARHAAPAHLGKAGGLRADGWWWWLRRWPV